MSAYSDPTRIDFDTTRDIAFRGVRRTACFLAFGLNSTSTSGFGDPSLKHYSLYEFLNPIGNESELDLAVIEYKLWILQSGFRDLIESFSIFIDRIFADCLLISLNNSMIDIEKLDRDVKSFAAQSISNRLSRLRTDFQVSCTYESYIISIYKARNCYTHRQGIVGSKDVQGNGGLTVQWVAIDGFTADPSGTKTPVPLAQQEPFLLKSGHTLLLENATRIKSFAVGERLIFSTREVTEICYFALLCADELTAKSLDFARKNGVLIDQP